MSQTSFNAAPLDTYAEQITSGMAMLGGLLTLPALFFYLSGMLRNGVAVTGVVVTLAVALAVFIWLLLNYLVQPTLYVIGEHELVIKRRWFRAMRVPFDQISGVSLALGLADVPRFGLRRSFNAGVFGYQGPFQLERYGAVFFAATNRERLVALARRDRTPLILSPARPRDFVEDLRDTLSKQPDAADGA